MRLENLTGKAKQALKKIKSWIIQDCPPELDACEVCRKLECNNEEWLNCEKRLRAAEFMKSFGKSGSDLSEICCPHDTGTNLEHPASSPSDSGSDDA